MTPNSPKSQPPPPHVFGRRRVGLFGGSFDPVHNGHLAVAQACRDRARLDEVWFVPTAVQPHKPGGPVASDQQRVALLNHALADKQGLVTSLVEIERGGVSYTVDTLGELNSSYPRHQFFLLMGADTLHDLPNWRQPDKVLRLATPLVVRRAGEPSPDFTVLSSIVSPDRVRAIKDSEVDMPAVDISSSAIRKRVAQKESIKALVPQAVARFIAEHQLYADG